MTTSINADGNGPKKSSISGRDSLWSSTGGEGDYVPPVRNDDTLVLRIRRSRMRSRWSTR